MSNMILGIAVVFSFVALDTDAATPVNDGYCPSNYPNVYLSGKWCCKYDKEKIYKPGGTKCDGSKIGFDSTCCEKDAAVQCIYSSCKSYIRDLQCVGGESWITKDEKCISLCKQKRKDNSNVVGVVFSTTYHGMCYCAQNEDELKLSDYKVEIYKTCKFEFNLPSGNSFLKEFAIRKNQLLTTLDTVGKEYSVSFEVKPTSFINTWGSLIHLTVGTDQSVYGDRTPAGFFYQAVLYVCGAVNGSPNYYKTTPAFTKGVWTSMKIVQVKSGSVYRWKFFFNDKMIHDTVNSNPKEFKNVKVYAGDPWYTPQPGFIRNLIIKA